jgi:hypothetical protein
MVFADSLTKAGRLVAIQQMFWIWHRILSAVFAIEGTPKAQQEEAIASGPVTQTLSSLAQQALAHYNKAKAYLRNADWSKYSDELNQLEAILKEMNPKKGKAPQKAPKAPSAP